MAACSRCGVPWLIRMFLRWQHVPYVGCHDSETVRTIMHSPSMWHNHAVPVSMHHTTPHYFHMFVNCYVRIASTASSMQTVTVALCPGARMGLRGSGGLNGRNGKPLFWTFHSVRRGADPHCHLNFLSTFDLLIAKCEMGKKGPGKGKGLGTCYSAAYKTRTAALYNLGSGSWLAWANITDNRGAMRLSIARDSGQLDPRCSTQTYHCPNCPNQCTRPSPCSPWAIAHFPSRWG